MHLAHCACAHQAINSNFLLTPVLRRAFNFKNFSSPRCLTRRHEHRQLNPMSFPEAVVTDVRRAHVCHRGGRWSFLVTGISCEVWPWGVNKEYERSCSLQEKVSHTVQLVCRWISQQIKPDFTCKAWLRNRVTPIITTTTHFKPKIIW